MIARSVLCAALLCASVPLSMADSLIEESRNARATISQDQDSLTAHVVNQRFEPTTLADDRSGEILLRRVLATIEIERITRDSGEGETEILQSTVRANVRPIEPDLLGPPMLSIEAPGDEVSISGPFLIVSRWGCCALQASHAVYSMLSGAKLFSATGQGEFGDWITLGSRHKPNEPRYLAAHVAPTLSDPTELGEDERTVIALTYANDREALQRLIVVAPAGRSSDEVLNWSATLAWVTEAEPGGADHVFVPSDAPASAAYDGITLRMQLGERTRIEIPLERDRLAWKKALLPDGFELTEVSTN